TMAERSGGKIEAAVAGVILVVVVVLFAKYYERGTGPDSAANTKPAATEGVQ
ncbi:hypothetical protein HY251_03790, partial [bacterium]|nr:hypothetical protein [bacterium]